MTPQERQLVAELFDRLAALESAPRDPDAERTIAEGQQRAPHAPYALVQTVLVQDEALKRAHARIQELEGRPAEEPSRGFLDNMRDTLFGRDERRGSVPPVRQGGLGSSGAWGQPAGSPSPSAMGMAPAGMGPSPIGSGGSFLGTAAASAAGVIGGAMLLNGIRSMFGPHYGGAAAFDPASAGSQSGGSAASSDLARQAGAEHVGRGDEASGGGRSGLFGGDDQSGDPLASNDDDDGNYDSGDDGSYDSDDDGSYDSDDNGDFGGGDTEDV